MRQIRNKLLIALVLFGVVTAAAASAQTGSVVQVKKISLDPSDPKLQPGATPTAGEPDVTGGNAPIRYAMAPTSRVGDGTAMPRMRVVSLTAAGTIRWAWVIWMARYLNQVP